MATDPQPGAPGGALADKPTVLGLLSMVLFSVSAILVADTVASSAEMGVPELGFWILTGGGTAVSLFIGWCLHRQSTRRSGSTPATVSDVRR